MRQTMENKQRIKTLVLCSILLTLLFSFLSFGAETSYVDVTGLKTELKLEILQGTPPGERFRFSIEALEEGAPLPEKTIAEINGSDETEAHFGTLHFSAPGVYHYRIRQLAGETAGMQYDTTGYFVTVHVVEAAENAGGLAAETMVQKEGETAKSGSLQYTNVFRGTVPAETRGRDDDDDEPYTTPGETAESSELPPGRVLGAERWPEVIAEAITETPGRVLGAVRRTVKTGDAGAVTGYLLGLLASSMLLFGWGIYKNKTSAPK